MHPEIYSAASSPASDSPPLEPAKSAVGILAYGSLINDPGPEIGPFIQEVIPDIKTPFSVEYARSSQSRGGAPTLVPVAGDDGHVNAVIQILRPSVSVELAQDWLWRRETRQYGMNDHYQRKDRPGRNSVVIESLANDSRVQTLLYTRIAANISPLTAEELAKRAMASAQDPTVKAGNDGISYLINAKKHGILTPLTDAYEKAILAQTQTTNLPAALATVRGKLVNPALADRVPIIKAFIEDCVWARITRTIFEQLYESGEKRHQLLAETAKGFFQDLNAIVLEYVLLQMHKLIERGSSGTDQRNLTTNTLLELEWKPETRTQLQAENERLQDFGRKIAVARNKRIAHTDLSSRLEFDALGIFTQDEETAFWDALQRFVDIAHDGAIGGPSGGIDAATTDGDANTLIHCLADAVDYDDWTKDDKALSQRIGKRRYDGA